MAALPLNTASHFVFYYRFCNSLDFYCALHPKNLFLSFSRTFPDYQGDFFKFKDNSRTNCIFLEFQEFSRTKVIFKDFSRSVRTLQFDQIPLNTPVLNEQKIAVWSVDLLK